MSLCLFCLCVLVVSWFLFDMFVDAHLALTSGFLSFPTSCTSCPPCPSKRPPLTNSNGAGCGGFDWRFFYGAWARHEGPAPAAHQPTQPSSWVIRRLAQATWAIEHAGLRASALRNPLQAWSSPPPTGVTRPFAVRFVVLSFCLYYHWRWAWPLGKVACRACLTRTETWVGCMTLWGSLLPFLRAQRA